MDDAFKEEIEIGSSVESLMELLASQKELFHSQIDQLQDVVVTQCKLTGVNPLAQEMAAGALSIKIGKRPRDLLNPKAVKYLQAVFAIKDSISKRECREISALFGISVAQIRDFIVTQRIRVRKQVRLSREKVMMSSALALRGDGVPENNNAIPHVDPLPLNSMDPDASSISWGGGETVAVMPKEDDPQEEIPPDISDSDKYFVENIFSLLRKEETFLGQVKLLEWIMQIQDSSVLIWFLSRGGVLILTTWLSQAAMEEQTSVLLLILKVLCHLPLHKASPENMSAILQSVNGLRFYRTSDISNKAKGLLSRWTKLFSKIQAMKKQNRNNSQVDSQSQLLLKQSIAEIMGDSSNPEDVLSLSNGRRLKSSQDPKLLLTSADDSTKKQTLGSTPSYNKERRKVQMVEQPGQKAAGRSPQTIRIGTSGRSRPMSADDIQKAKMRAMYMHSKNSKKDSLSSAIADSRTIIPERPLALQSAKDSTPSEKNGAKTEDKPVPSAGQPVNSPADNLLVQPVNSQGANVPVQPVSSPAESLLVQPVSSAAVSLPVQPDSSAAVKVPVQADEFRKPSTPPKSISNKVGFLLKMSPQTILKNCKRKQIDWHVPPGMELDKLWRVAAGGNSKETDIQKNRNRREKEITYQSLQTIPLNPKEPWDREMDYDDSLTPEIPSQQPPEESITEPHESLDDRQTATGAATTSSSQSSSMEPDFELLAALLKNPDLVYALTSGKPGNLAGQDMVKLLDVIKTGAPNSSSSSCKEVEEKVEVSLPSPTPSTNPGMSGLGQEVIRNPFSRQNQVGAPVARMSTRLPVAAMQWQPSNEQSISLHTPSAYNSLTLPHTERQQQPMQPKLPHQSRYLQHQQPISTTSYAVREPFGQMGTATSATWRSQQSENSYYTPQANGIASASASAYQVSDQYMSSSNNPGFESWSPDHSPSRNLPNMRGQQQQPYRKHDSSSHPYWNQNRRWR